MSFGTVSELFIVVLASYLFLLFIVRLSGKRTLLKMNAFDFIVTVTISAVFGGTLMNYETKLWQGLYILFLLLFFQFISSFLAANSEFFGKLLKANPTLLFYDGSYNYPVMKKERIPKSEILQAIREEGIGSVEEVGAVVLETDGTISVLPKEQNHDKELDTLENVQ